MVEQRSPSERALHRLTKRCVECPPDQPSCPNCSAEETCSLIPQSCSACASTACVKTKSLPGQTQASGNSTPLGPIIGGVVGGVFVIVVSIFLVWRYCLRGKRRKDTWVPPEKSSVTRSGTVSSRADSISTVGTRASNVIPIAYIPGVTVRSNPDTPEIPPIPSSYAGTTVTASPDTEQYMFMPSRDSTWSDATSMHSGNRISLTPSLANRASVATTLYRSDAVVPPIPAQYAYQTQANVVSVRSGSSTPSSGHTPPIPQGPKVQQIQAVSGAKVVARNVMARPVEIKKTGVHANTVPTLGNLAKRSSQIRVREPRLAVISDEKEVVATPSTIFDESPVLPRSQLDSSYMSNPASTMASSMAPNYPTTSADISAMIQNAIMNATSSTAQGVPRHDIHKHDSGPFSDANEINENRQGMI